MAIDAATIRAFRLLLRDFFDAQFDDWGEEANEPRFVVIEQFLQDNTEVREELVELLRFAFFDSRDGICAILERLGSQLNPAALTEEINEYGERRPRDTRTGYVRRMHEALQQSVQGAE
jgi:hypothetical protein